MSQILTIALHAEGSTDYRFLKPIIQRTIEDIILNSDCDIELYPILEIKKQLGQNYCNEITVASKESYSSGISYLIIHCDSDSSNDDSVLKNKINPAIKAVTEHEDKVTMCTNIIPLIPIHMTESWMLADIELLKSEISATTIDNNFLGLSKNPETYSDPKAIIKKSIAIAQQATTKRRRTFDITELYTPLGQKINLNQLKKLKSYQNFYDSLKNTALPYC